jgi:hypothetical protein
MEGEERDGIATNPSDVCTRELRLLSLGSGDVGVC